MVAAKVSTSTDWGLSALWVSPHTTLGPPPLPPILPFVEVPATMWWPPGRLTGQNKFALTVKHQDCMVAQQGHDIGVLEVHFGTSCPGLAVATCTSSRKVMFSASTVRMGGTPAAVVDHRVGLPGLVCASPVPLPTFFASNDFNTVTVDVNGADIISGALSIVATMVASFFTRTSSFPVGQAVGAAVGAATGVAQVLLTQQGSVSVSLGYPPLSVSVSVNFNDGKFQSASVGAGPLTGQVDGSGKVSVSGASGNQHAVGTVPSQRVDSNPTPTI